MFFTSGKKQCKIQDKMSNYAKMEKKENCKSFGNRTKVMKLWIITLKIQLKKHNKQKNKPAK